MTNTPKLAALGVGAAGLAATGWIGARFIANAVAQAAAVEEAWLLVQALAPDGIVTDAMRQEAAVLQYNAQLFYGQGRVAADYGPRRLYVLMAEGNWPPQEKAPA